MHLLPVIDLLDGMVVRAIAGQRSNYKPICSPLAGSAEPIAVLRSLFGLAPFGAIYVADLDAIVGAGSDRHFDILRKLCAKLAALGGDELWLDAGAATWLEELGATAAAQGVRLVPVLGSESLADRSALAARRASLADLDCVLSLDYRAGEFLGPADLDRSPAQWPRRVVVMELAAVGADSGPALQRFDEVVTTARDGGRQDIVFYAAGGVRDVADLRRLASHGAGGVLLASALHDGRIDAGELHDIMSKG